MINTGSLKPEKEWEEEEMVEEEMVGGKEGKAENSDGSGGVSQGSVRVR